MYVVNLQYLKSIEEVDQHLEAHRAFLDDQFAKGLFLASGAKTPRTGGVFIVRGMVSLTELNALLEADPFHRNTVAQYEILDFTPTKYHPALSELL